MARISWKHKRGTLSFLYGEVALNSIKFLFVWAHWENGKNESAEAKPVMTKMSHWGKRHLVVACVWVCLLRCSFHSNLRKFKVGLNFFIKDPSWDRIMLWPLFEDCILRKGVMVKCPLPQVARCLWTPCW